MVTNLVSSGVVNNNFIKEEKEFEMLLYELCVSLALYNTKQYNEILSQLKYKTN